MDWFKIEKCVQHYILSPCLFNIYAEYIMWNAGLDEAQDGIKTTRKGLPLTVQWLRLHAPRAGEPTHGYKDSRVHCRYSS